MIIIAYMPNASIEAHGKEEPHRRYAVRLATFQGEPAIEISNDGPASFFPPGTIFSVSAEPIPTLSVQEQIVLAAILLGIFVWLLAAGAKASPGRQ